MDCCCTFCLAYIMHSERPYSEARVGRKGPPMKDLAPCALFELKIKQEKPEETMCLFAFRYRHAVCASQKHSKVQYFLQSSQISLR